MKDEKGEKARQGYTRNETLLPIRAFQIVPIDDRPDRCVLYLLTEDGSLALGVDKESSKAMGEALLKASNRLSLPN